MKMVIEEQNLKDEFSGAGTLICLDLKALVTLYSVVKRALLVHVMIK